MEHLTDWISDGDRVSIYFDNAEYNLAKVTVKCILHEGGIVVEDGLGQWFIAKDYKLVKMLG